MGSAKSKSVVEQTNEILNDILVSSSQNCRQVVNATQQINVVDRDGNISILGNRFNQAASVNLQCLASNDVKTEILNKITDEIKQQTEATLDALSLTPGSTKATSITQLFNTIENSLKFSYNQDCINSIQLQQGINIESGTGNVLIENNQFDQVMDVVARCMTQNQTFVQAATNLQTEIDQLTEAETEGISGIFDNLLGGIFAGSAIRIIVIIVIVVILLIMGLGIILLVTKK